LYLIFSTQYAGYTPFEGTIAYASYIIFSAMFFTSVPYVKNIAFDMSQQRLLTYLLTVF